MRALKDMVKGGLQSSFDISLKKHSTAISEIATLQQAVERNKQAAFDLDFLQALPHEHAPQFLRFLSSSKAQLRQDLFVLSQLNFKRDGFFVEFGATNGVDLSNTHILEKSFGWNGILAEPANCWHQALQANRSAAIEQRCVWKDSVSTLTFNEVEVAELSTIHAYSDTDLHKNSRQHGKTYEVKTISLNELLIKHNAPASIDYLSIDTEGSEYEILKNFDFKKHSIQLITCEHNFTPMREKLFDLLSSNGYMRKYEAISQFDDWYIKAGPA